jgi:hypothetical protein
LLDKGNPRAQLQKIFLISESFILKQHAVAKLLKEIEEVCVINPALQAEYDALPPPTSGQTGSSSFSFRFPPTLGTIAAEDAMLVLARRAIFRFLCEQILTGFSILCSLGPTHETQSANVKHFPSLKAV